MNTRITKSGAIATIDGNTLTTSIEVVGHKFACDEPVEDGGFDTTASPRQYLAASIAACKAITAQLYARRKGWDLNRVSVLIDYRKETVTAADGSASIEHHFDTVVSLGGKLDPEQRERLMVITTRCPVSRIVEEGARVHSRLAE